MQEYHITDSDEASSDRDDDDDDEDREEEKDNEHKQETTKNKKKGRKRKKSRDYMVTNFLNFTFEDIKQQFEHPISRAAKSLNVSETYLKKLCRHFNIYRWPYRKLTSLQKRIDHLCGGIPEEELSEEARGQIAEIREEMKAIKDNPSLVLKQTSKLRAEKDGRSQKMSAPPSPISESSTSPNEKTTIKSERNIRYAPYPSDIKSRSPPQMEQNFPIMPNRNQQNFPSSTLPIDSNIIHSQQQVQVQHLPQTQHVLHPQQMPTSPSAHQLQHQIQQQQIQQQQRSLSIALQQRIENFIPPQIPPLGLRLDAEEIASILSEPQLYHGDTLSSCKNL